MTCKVEDLNNQSIGAYRKRLRRMVTGALDVMSQAEDASAYDAMFAVLVDEIEVDEWPRMTHEQVQALVDYRRRTDQ